MDDGLASQPGKERRTFRIEGVDVPTARLRQIVESEHAAGRDNDLLFLATHKDALEQLLKRSDTWAA